MTRYNRFYIWWLLGNALIGIVCGAAIGYFLTAH
jgi:hypothetical protein